MKFQMVLTLFMLIVAFSKATPVSVTDTPHNRFYQDIATETPSDALVLADLKHVQHTDFISHTSYFATPEAERSLIHYQTSPAEVLPDIRLRPYYKLYNLNNRNSERCQPLMRTFLMKEPRPPLRA